MKFSTNRETLLRPLGMVTGVIERPSSATPLPVLANVLVEADENGLSLTGTDMEVEFHARVEEGVEVAQVGKVTVPGRKLASIWRALAEGAEVAVESGAQVTVRSGRSRFTLATAPVEDFPKVPVQDTVGELSVTPEDLKHLVEQTSFAVAQNDVRYYLNGLLLEVTDAHVRAVATDGHRLAMCTNEGGVAGVERVRAIIPRKGVGELNRLLAEAEEPVAITIGDNVLQARNGPYTLTTKLIDGEFPDYERVIPRQGQHSMTGSRATLHHSLTGAAILSNETYRGVRLSFDKEQLTVRANNPDQEEAEDTVPVDYEGEQIEIGFNVDYLLDVINVIPGETVRLSVSDANSSALIDLPDEDRSLFVVMPMRL